MEFGAIFILVLVVIVLAVLGGGLYALTMWLRGRQLHPEGNKLEDAPEPDQRRPEHVEAENEQRTHYVGTR